ncbi:BQ5605_C011g06259 [Microbotryum silenes-dioicae]|nr:BQ5605_C011g06259 [Microbotryum silenes-dioicae]
MLQKSLKSPRKRVPSVCGRAAAYRKWLAARVTSAGVARGSRLQTSLPCFAGWLAASLGSAGGISQAGHAPKGGKPLLGMCARAD